MTEFTNQLTFSLSNECLPKLKEFVAVLDASLDKLGIQSYEFS